MVGVWRISAGAIYHCTVMPCYDKKLEAARDDFIFGAESGATEVDCVLTSGEILDLLKVTLHSSLWGGACLYGAIIVS